MNGYEFVSTVVGAVVWPALIAFALYTIAKSLGEMD